MVEELDQLEHDEPDEEEEEIDEAQVKREAFRQRTSDLIEFGVERARQLDKPIFVSITEELDDGDTLHFFANSITSAAERWFWEHPAGDLSVAASGVLMGRMPSAIRRYQRVTEAYKELMEDAVIDPEPGEDNAGPVFFNAFAFDPKNRTERNFWLGFSSAYIVAPQVSMVRRGDRRFLTLNILASPKRRFKDMVTSVVDLRDRAHLWLEREIKHYDPRIEEQEEPEGETDEDAFRKCVEAARAATSNGTLEKVVVARRREIKAGGVFDVAGALGWLREEYPTCYTFGLARRDSSILGASPEQLVKLDGNKISTACIAGSIRRSEDEEEDAALADELLNSAKDRHEHAVCVKAIREALEVHCSDISMPDEPEIMTLANVHHLHTPVTATLNEDSNVMQVIQELHPTPAVGGYPKEEALEFIREHEDFNRGWYASPFGWIDGEGNGEFIVTLRSAMIKINRAFLFSGCGIVAESDTEKELEESELKLQPMITALCETHE